MKNDYEVRGDVVAIIINSPKYGRFEALISTNKLEVVKSFPNTWRVFWEKNLNSFYARGNLRISGVKVTSVYLHRLITNAPVGMVVDHINHNTLDNTNSNLRITTHGENQQNRKGASKHSKSGIRGVSWSKKQKKWISTIKLNGKQVKLGAFDDINEAELSTITARAKYMPYSMDA